MKPTLYRRTATLMGNRFDFGIVANDETWAGLRIDEAIAEIKRIESLLSTYRDDSQTQAINRNAGKRPVQVSPEVFDLIRRCQYISGLTQGAFDITYGSIDRSLWNFDVTMTALPSVETARQMVRLINYQNIELNPENHSVLLKEKGMRIGFGGIGKGYAAEMARRIIVKNGVASGIINASGDLTTWGKRPDGSDWTIGIADPNQQDHPFSFLNISDAAVATSGSYEKFVMIDGRRYSHTIDPKTGFPVSGIKSVTIISPNAELSDALATPVTVMGVEVGLHLINQLKHVACIIIDDEDRTFCSKNISM